MSRLLILAASDDKITEAPLKIRAINLYDSPAFRALRSYLSEVPTCGADDLMIAVISPQHGLFDGMDHISPYLGRWSPAVALQMLRSRLFRRTLQFLFKDMPSAMVFANSEPMGLMREMMSRTFGGVNVPNGAEKIARTQFVAGPVGTLKAWLEAGTLNDADRAAAIAETIWCLQYSGKAEPGEISRLEDELAKAVRRARSRSA